MDSIITSYGIAFPGFRQLLRDLDGVVAGSAALAGYLKQEGIEYNYQPNDLDIFIPDIIQQDVDERGYTIDDKCHIESLDTMKEFLASYGYIENDKFDKTITHPWLSPDYGNINNILKVTSFNNRNNKEIQVIIINTNNIMQYINTDFDLSICISWWDSNKNCFKTMNPDTTKRKEMYFVKNINISDMNENDRMRFEKYISRGFTLINKPCPFTNYPDPRELLLDAKFSDIEVTDIFTLDDYPIRDYLEKSEWNIVLKAGNTYYGFERRTLMDFMNTKSVRIARIGTFYQTPLNQCISLEAFNKLRYSDYSIYELKNAYSVPNNRGGVYSLFHMHCYSIKDWVENSEGTKISIPPQSILQSYNRRRIYDQIINQQNIDEIIELYQNLVQSSEIDP
jgi:hypothetical protein